ncbi:hypothetical protein [Fodinibius salsisoli]|uniref:Uncharacterized protein n=1 Tax=Fodinibius salsisoli TaxID=2820877 RepID=A0ABT3PRC3_9BACT|nr:hypothetical protein [Fodinibius salsisoli]MCW9708404.1 hypothetical protein [Fodinibius salsisoli]
MIRTLFSLIFLMLLPAMVWGQSLTIAPTPATSTNEPSEFTMEGGAKIKLDGNSLHFLNSGKRVSQYFAFGVSQDRSVLSLLGYSDGKAQITLFTPLGDTLNSYASISVNPNDPSLAVYPVSSGHLLLRDNIMNFIWHDGLGNKGTNISSGSGSQQGETISEVAMSTDRQTVVVYTPKIKLKNGLGSKAELLKADDEFQRIFQSDSRYIKDLGVADDGNLITVVTAAEGTSDEVIILDKYGNEINTFTIEEPVLGANLAADGKHITVYSNKRVGVYNTLNGERLGRASLREAVLSADYFPADQMIVLLSGDYSSASGILNDVQVKAIDLEKRDIVSEGYSGALGFNEAFTLSFERLSTNKYQFNGSNKELIIDVAF